MESAVAVSLSTIQACANASEIVGWYSVPELVRDEKPGAAILRAVTSLDNLSEQPILAILSRTEIDNIIESGCEKCGGVKVFGKDFGMQWNELLHSTVSLEATPTTDWLQVMVNDEHVCDLVDHWLLPLGTEWPRTAAIQQKIARYFG